MLFQPRSRKTIYQICPSHKRQQGVVIVVALFVVALVATMAYVMMARLERDTRRTELILHDTQAEYYAQGSVMWAKDQLRNDWVKKKPNTVIDRLPIESPVNDMNGYKISSTILDAQGKFNINNVSKPDWQKAFIRLIKMVDPDTTDQAASDIAKATFDWVMPGDRDNEYSRYYAQLPVPYRPAHRFMLDASELRLVKGVEPKLYEALKPYITALPSITPINPLSAKPPVLALISPIMTLNTAKQLREILDKTPPVKLEDLMKIDLIKNHKVDEKRVTLTSSYFLVETQVKINQQDIILNTLMQRDSLGGRADVAILWQKRGVS